MRIAIVGTRSKLSAHEASVINNRINETSPDTVIVTGDCPTGVDSFVADCCKGFRTLIVCHAAWETHKLSAGPIRNAEIADIANMVLAFPRGISKGTRGCVKLFCDAGKPHEVVEL